MTVRLSFILGAVLAMIAVAGSARAAQSPEQVLSDRQFGFCHDPSYPLTDDEAKWCPVLAESARGCPEFRSACDAPRARLQGDPGPLAARTIADADDDDDDDDDSSVRDEGSGDDDGGHGRRADAPSGASGPDRSDPGSHSRDRRRPLDPNREIEDDYGPVVGSVGPLAHVLLWVIVGAMLILVLAQLRGPSIRRSSPVQPGAEADAPQDTGSQPLARATETDVERLLARAQRRAEQGELAEAIDDGHAALLRCLSERGRIELHPSRTNGDHVRALRDDPGLFAATRDVMRVVERVQFGHALPSSPQVVELLARVRAVVGGLGGLILMVWIGAACTTAQSPREYPWSYSPSGSAGVLELLRSHGLSPTYRSAALTDGSMGGSTPVVLDEAALTDGEWTKVLNHVRDGGRAVVATTELLPRALPIGHARRAGATLAPLSSGGWGPDRSAAVPGHQGLYLETPADTDAHILLADPSGVPYAVRMRLGEGEVVVLADDRMFTNASLAVPDNGMFLVELLRELDDEFQLLEGGLRAASADGASDPFDAIARAHLTPVIAQLLLLVLLIYLWRGVHFSPPRDPPPPSRRRFTEHAAALAQHYIRAQGRRHALRLYAGWALERIHERFGGRQRGLPHLARRIAARTGRDETESLRILLEAQDARDDTHDDRGSDEDLRVIRELGRLIDTTRGPR